MTFICEFCWMLRKLITIIFRKEFLVIWFSEVALFSSRRSIIHVSKYIIYALSVITFTIF